MQANKNFLKVAGGLSPLTLRGGTHRKLPSLERKSAFASFAKRKKHTAASPLSLKLFYHKYPDRSTLKKSARAVSVSTLKTAEKEFYVAFYQPKWFRKTNLTTYDPSILCPLGRSRKSKNNRKRFYILVKTQLYRDFLLCLK